MHNKLQTKRQGQIVNFADWNLYTDWRLRPGQDQTTFAPVNSDLVLRPRSWMTFESLTRYDIHDGQFLQALDTLTFQPNESWSWGLGNWYVRDDFRNVSTALGQGNSVFTSTLSFRLNENWGLRASHYLDARNGHLREQSYTIFRDLRSWTAALSFRVRDNITGPQDVTVAFTLSLKAFPRYGITTDSLSTYSLLGG